MSITSDLLGGIATVLNTASVVTWRSDGSVYLSTETAVAFRVQPASPDRCVTLTNYLATDEVLQARSRLAVQLRFRGSRGDTLDVDDLADSAFQVLQTLTGVQMGSVWLIQLLRTSVASLGQDDSRRSERADNYYADVNTPPTTARQ